MAAVSKKTPFTVHKQFSYFHHVNFKKKALRLKIKEKIKIHPKLPGTYGYFPEFKKKNYKNRKEKFFVF